MIEEMKHCKMDMKLLIRQGHPNLLFYVFYGFAL